MEKALIPREIVSAIDNLKNEEWHDYNIVSALANHHSYGSIDLTLLSNYFEDCCPESETHPNFLMKALVNGYDIKQSPEEKVQELYWSYINGGHQSEGAAIRAAFTLYGIKIDGVNT